MQTDLRDVTEDAALAAGATVFSVAEARRLVQQFAEVTTSRDVEAFLAGFTEDCVVQYAQFPEMRGKAQFRPFVRGMLSDRLRDFACHKQLRALSGNVIGATWTARWTDGETDKRKFARGFEFWIMRGEQIARWDAAVNAWDAPAGA